MAKNLNGKLHYHACVHCKLRYDDACHNQDIDDACPSCRMGRFSTYRESITPRAECCIAECKPAHKLDLETYRLRGEGHWWICGSCKRQFGWNPKETR